MESTTVSDQQNLDDQTDDEEKIVKSKTFYYSNFDLFDESSHFFFLKYQIFKKSLSAFLGEDWNSYANMTIYFEKQYAKVYIEKKTIFNTALEVWLELRKTISPERNFEEFSIFESFLNKFVEKFQSYKINNSTFKPVMQGFYVSAIKVWNDLIAGKDIWKVKIEENKEQNEEQKEGTSTQTQTPRALERPSEESIPLNETSNKNSYFQSKSKIIKPLLVAKEKIFGYFNAASKKNNTGSNTEINLNLIERSPSFHEEMENDNDLKNYKNFNSTMKIEAGNEIANSIKNLSEVEMKNLLTRDPYAFNIKNINQKRRNNGPPFSQENIFIEVTKLTKKEEKVFNNNVISHVSDFAEKIGNSKENRWQVARNLVTTMIEVNYNYFMSNIAQSIILNKAKDLRIRFLQPAQEFYNQLMDTWLISKSNSLNSEVRFKDYLEKVKSTFGTSWNENLAGPTQFFFNTLYLEWNKIKEEDTMEDTHEDRVRLFVRRVRENMLKMWEENIIKKAEELDNKVIQQHQNRDSGV